MNKSLATFMGIASVAIITISLLFGVTFNGVKEKSNYQQDLLRTQNQIQTK
ncbi:hypothetical protein HPT25_26280 [Bacillus sp. BRMEA1]|uniref:hypothetical protein n=1 Tax=Neobacillus endophyticus TaxID=2738405 RepID=UPI0015637B52|nr:hypothetical protein [Neobacillus endophyticus]NRD80839.1 hypothetical protein [Neobacillus endophyticus]